MDVVAICNGVEKKFTSIQWGLLPAHKNGWKVKVKTPSEVSEKSDFEKAVDESIERAEEKPVDAPVMKSTEVSVAEAISIINDMPCTPIEAIDVFIEGDDRVTVQRAAAKKIKSCK